MNGTSAASLVGATQHYSGTRGSDGNTDLVGTRQPRVLERVLAAQVSRLRAQLNAVTSTALDQESTGT
jgi:hypothetical protein